MRVTRVLAAAALAALMIGCASSRPATRGSVTSRAHAPAGPGPEEGGPLANLTRWTGLARSFPDSVVRWNRRLLAFDSLLSIRDLLHLPYWPPPQFVPGVKPPPVPPTVPCEWHPIGPSNVNGRVTGMAVDPVDPDKLILTTVGGVWRSTDGARTWERVSDLSDMMAGVYSAVAINPGDPAEVFVAGGDTNLELLWRGGGPGLWRSDQGGAAGSWRHMDAGVADLDGLSLDSRLVFKIVVAPTSPYTVYVASDTGVFVGTRTATAPAQIAWARLGNLRRPCSDIAVDFTGATPIVYAGVFKRLATNNDDDAGKGGIWRYADGAWTQAFKSSITAARGGVVSLAVSRRSPPVLYAQIEDYRSRDPGWSGGDLLGVYKSTNGATWSKIDGWESASDYSHYAWFNSTLAVDPDDPDALYVGGLWLRRYRSGAGWTTISSNPGGTNWIHRDQHALAVVSAGSSRWLYVGNDGGLDRLSIPPASAPWPSDWSWQGCDHGLEITEFYDLAVQSETPMAIVGGTQDNGSPATFGNRTWQYVAQCDAGRVAMDAPISSTIYEGCVDPPPALVGLAHPIPQAQMGAAQAQMAAPLLWNGLCRRACPPVAAHPEYPGIAIAAQCTEEGAEPARLLELGAGNCWRDAGAPLDPKATLQCVAIGGASPDTTYYVGFTVPSGDTWTSSIWSSSDGGTTWNDTPSGLPSDLMPTRVVIDREDPRHAYACYGGESGGDVYVTLDAGADWQRIAAGAQPLPPATVQDLVISPVDPNLLYVATEVGVFRGVVTPGTPPKADWSSFDAGLPNGVDVTCLEVNDVTRTLIAGTLGYGAYEISIGGEKCPRDMVLVRDNVFDRGDEPSPHHVPNPEDPIVDPVRSRPDATFYKHNDIDPGGLVYWWTSEDVRISVPGYGPESGAWIVDPVSVEACAPSAGACPPGTIPDEAPVRGRHADVRVQVHNRGVRTAHHVRVLAIWTDASVSVPPLPDGFWTTTFPANATSCGPWPKSTDWHFFDDADCASSFAIIDELPPDASRVVTFGWEVPHWPGDHCCVLVIVESDEDPLPADVRTSNQRSCSVLVPNHHQIGQRNLHLVSASELAHLMTYSLTNTAKRRSPFRLFLSMGSLPPASRLDLFVPAQLDSVTAVHFDSVVTRFSLMDQQRAAQLMLNTMLAYRLTGPQGEIRGGGMPPGATWHFGLMLQRPGHSAEVGRFTVVAERDSSVIGGNTYIVTPRP